jgi:ribosomal protein S25
VKIEMSRSVFVTSEDLVKELGVSRSFAYKVIRTMNEELKNKGFMTVHGKVSRKYFEERFYGVGHEKEKEAL